MTGGELGGRRLRSVVRGVRPTADRVRESLFARLGDLSGAVVLDLYAGTGVMGIEAVSRGAARVVFVERSRQALATLRDNLKSLGLDAEVEVLAGDATRCVRRLGAAGECFDLVLLDPPYDGDELPKALAALSEAHVVAEHGTLVVEHGRRHPVPIVEEWAALDEWEYGETLVTRLGRSRSVGAGGRDS